MAQSGTSNQRLPITYFEGINGAVQHAIAKQTELSHAENARTKTIGAIEKREGQAKMGTTVNGLPFYAIHNYGLTKFINNGSNQGIFRVTSAPAQDAAILLVSVYELVSVGDYPLVGGNVPKLLIKAVDYVTVSEPIIASRLDGRVIMLDGTSDAASIYALDTSSNWVQLSDPDAQNIIGAPTDFARVDDNLILVNGKDYNRMIGADGVTVTPSTAPGSLYNSPRAAKVAYYKSRIYLANIIRDGVKYKTTVMRSSYPLGIVALFNGDLAAVNTSGNWVIPVTDSNYFYADTGMNVYEVYRGNAKIATVTLDSLQETTVTATNAHVVFEAGFTGFLSADEIWVGGTFSGEKQYRWVGGSASISRDVKQYDTFKLVGGDEDGITMMLLIGNVMLVANKNMMMTWNDYMLENMDLGIGCVSPKGYAKLMGSAYFIHYTGVYSTTGGIPVLISRKVERYIKGATRNGLEKAAAGYKGLSVFFCIGDSTLYNSDGSLWKVMPDVCLEYNIADQTWFVHTNVSASQFATFIDTLGQERVLLASKKPGESVKEFLVGNTDDGDVIFFRADTQVLQFSRAFELYAEPIEIMAEVDKGSSLECFVAVDEDEDFYALEGTFRKGVSTLKFTSEDPQRVKPQPCRKIRISFRDGSKQQAKLLQASISYIQTNMSTPGNE